MVDYRKLKELVKLMTENDLSELDLRDQQETVVIKRAQPAYAPMMGPPVVHHVQAAPASAAQAASGDAHAAPPPDDDADLVAIKSPMVGTFYSAPDPSSPPFVAAGASVGPDTVVCIVEAMKVFSEIKAECSGKIEKILVKSGDAVEYGQKLFLVRPA
ncbi:MAG: acetyl-CoA carboxylase biotin carboxyl carrier protein [Planctomycetota bacterium]|nr:acetyl-CoA carboxylase biotin carboxyl carrier protein [Planctomycetota bacterium]